MFGKLQTIIAVFCYLTAMTKGFKIRELSSEDDGGMATTSYPITESSYRRSEAKIKNTPHRVPEHLQFVTKGFVYEDSEDVIHVIDPPKQFEELKKIMQRQQQQQQWQQQNLRPIALREQRPKAKIVKTILPARHKSDPTVQIKASDEHDLQTQESSQHLPLEILASVRKTEKYIKKYKPKLPAVRQRLRTQKIQTVIWEKQQEQQQYQQGQQQRLQSVKEQNDNRRRFTKKRFRRDANSTSSSSNNNKNTAADKPLAGELLLQHLNELIKNASSYLRHTEYHDDYPDAEVTETSTLQGEIITAKIKNPLSNPTLNEDMVVKILENSVKATNAIMQQIKAQANLTTIQCDYSKVTYSNHIQNLQNQIKCMQNFIEDINRIQEQQQQEEQQHRPLQSLQHVNQKYGDRLESRKTKDLRHKPFIVAQLAEDYIDDTEPSPLNSSLIYNDVMTTIRNMLQSQNLQTMETVGAKSPNTCKEIFSENRFTYDKSPQPVDFQSLHEYLTSLEAIVRNLPKFNHKTLNLHEIASGSMSKYYFISPQGIIYSLPQPFHKDATTTTLAPTAIFHQLPDLPIIREYLRNGTLLPPSSQVIEIL